MDHHQSPSYWCYQCTTTISIQDQNTTTCPHCNGGFIHLINPTDFLPPPPLRRRNASSFNPLILLRTSSNSSSSSPPGPYELYYDDGSNTGLRPLPPTLSESLLGSGFELMLDRLSQIEFSLWSPPENPPASKTAVASLPTLEIASSHVESDAHCAVCMEAFEVGSEAKEMPCKHIYHSDCIFPWLDLHSSCPVCRHELPKEDGEGRGEEGLTIWRLPGGGFAVGRFAGVGGSGGGMPGVFSEMEGRMGLNGGVSSGIQWVRGRRSGGLRGFFGNLFGRRRGGGGGGSIRRSISVSGSSSGSGFSILSRFVSRRDRS